MNSAITITGLNQVQRFLINLAPKAKAEIRNITEAAGRTIEARAKQNAPVDLGKLRQSITFTPTKGGFGADVSVNVPYWAYVEFGTGGEVEIPEGFADLAGQFKGKGIRTVNRAAHPFLIPAFLSVRDSYYKAIQDAIGRILR